jgi:uridylate kinase
MQYNRVLMKLSGGAIAGDNAWGFDPAALNHIADEILKLHHAGIQVGVMVGGGNIFRGELGETWGIERAEADNIGMMATVINSLLLRGVLQARGDVEVRVMTAIPINSVAEPYIRLRAIRHFEHQAIVILAAGTGNPYVTTDYPAVQRALELRAGALLSAKNGTDGIYTGDPRHDSTARRYHTITYDKVIADNLRVMDQTAVLLARDYGLPIHVFNFDEPGAMLRICFGEHIGTRIGDVNTLEENE